MVDADARTPKTVGTGRFHQESIGTIKTYIKLCKLNEQEWFEATILLEQNRPAKPTEGVTVVQGLIIPIIILKSKLFFFNPLLKFSKHL